MKTFTKTLLAGAFLSASVLSAPAMAEQKIAVVDVQAVIQSLPQLADIQTRIQEEFKDQIQAVNSKQEEFNFLVQKLQRESATMSEDEQKALQEQIIALRDDLQQTGQPLQQSIERRQAEERNKLLGLIKQAIDGIAAKEDFDMVLNATAVPYAKTEHDISQKVQEQVSKAK